MKAIQLKSNEMKSLTWMDDVTGLIALDLGDSVKVVYEADIKCEVMDAIGIYTKDYFYKSIFNTTDKLN